MRAGTVDSFCAVAVEAKRLKDAFRPTFPAECKQFGIAGLVRLFAPVDVVDSKEFDSSFTATRAASAENAEKLATNLDSARAIIGVSLFAVFFSPLFAIRA